MDVRDNTTTSNGGLNESVELLVSADSKLHVTGSDSLGLEILAGVACEFEDLSSQVLKDGSSVDC